MGGKLVVKDLSIIREIEERLEITNDTYPQAYSFNCGRVFEYHQVDRTGYWLKWQRFEEINTRYEEVLYEREVIVLS